MAKKFKSLQNISLLQKHITARYRLTSALLQDVLWSAAVILYNAYTRWSSTVWKMFPEKQPSKENPICLQGRILHGKQIQ
jgi:hypothetical protein